MYCLKEKSSIYNAYSLTAGSYISGEVNLAVILRILAGDAAMYLAAIFDIYSDHYAKIIYEVLTQWIIPSDIGMINMTKYLGDDISMERVNYSMQPIANE